jgi:23S rRNA pseudouridine1911/1915/1917 synthase
MFLETKLNILYEDNHLFIVEKPCGIPTQDDPYSEVSMEFLGKEWIKERHKKPGNVFLQPLHRLDKPVSGIVLFAKTSKALSRLNVLMRERKIAKTYVAITDGYPPARSAVLEHFLVHDEHFARVVDAPSRLAKQAVLEYQLIGKKADKALIEIKLLTGRYHQIRCQLAFIGCPILGDRRYGSMQYHSQEGIALAHIGMQFEHPVTHKIIDIKLENPFSL